MIEKKVDHIRHAGMKNRQKMKGILRNSYGHFRAGWRISMFLIMIVLSLLPVIVLLKFIGWLFLFSGGDDLTSPINIIFMIGLAFSIAIASYITLKWIDKRPYELLGLNFSLYSIREFFIGCVIGASNLITIVLVLTTLGFFKVTWHGIDPAVLKTIFLYTLFFIAAAVIEELINRGYIFQALCEGTNICMAVVTTSLMFSIVHLFNPKMSYASTLFLFIHGILYAVAYLKTRSLWTAIAVHWSWNWLQGPIFGVNVSGAATSNSIFISHSRGADIWSGGEFGLEGSLISSLISLVFVVFVWRTEWFGATQRMVTLWSHYPVNFRSDL